MATLRAEQQLKAKVFRSCKSLSGAFKLLKRPRATRQAKLQAISDSSVAYETILDSMTGASPSCMQLYLDYAFPAKLWELAVCLLELLSTDEATMRTWYPSNCMTAW